MLGNRYRRALVARTLTTITGLFSISLDYLYVVPIETNNADRSISIVREPREATEFIWL